MKKIFFLLLGVFFFNNNILAQRQIIVNSDSIIVYNIINHDFELILDSFIIHESQYKYFSPEAIFFINILDSNGLVIQLSSGAVFDTLKINEKNDISKCGIFYYKNYRFFIKGRSIINKKVLKRTNNKYIIYRYKLLELDNEDYGEDDHYFPTNWVYHFNDNTNTFHEVWKSSAKLHE